MNVRGRGGASRHAGRSGLALLLLDLAVDEDRGATPEKNGPEQPAGHEEQGVTLVSGGIANGAKDVWGGKITKEVDHQGRDGDRVTTQVGLDTRQEHRVHWRHREQEEEFSAEHEGKEELDGVHEDRDEGKRQRNDGEEEGHVDPNKSAVLALPAQHPTFDQDSSHTFQIRLQTRRTMFSNLWDIDMTC